MKGPIEQLRWRMANGAAIDGDLEWAKRRLEVLEEWPDDLDRNQVEETSVLRGWLLEYAE